MARGVASQARPAAGTPDNRGIRSKVIQRPRAASSWNTSLFGLVSPSRSASPGRRRCPPWSSGPRKRRGGAACRGILRPSDRMAARAWRASHRSAASAGELRWRPPPQRDARRRSVRERRRIRAPARRPGSARGGEFRPRGPRSKSNRCLRSGGPAPADVTRDSLPPSAPERREARLPPRARPRSGGPRAEGRSSGSSRCRAPWPRCGAREGCARRSGRRSPASDGTLP